MRAKAGRTNSGGNLNTYVYYRLREGEMVIGRSELISPTRQTGPGKSFGHNGRVSPRWGRWGMWSQRKNQIIAS